MLIPSWANVASTVCWSWAGVMPAAGRRWQDVDSRPVDVGRLAVDGDLAQVQAGRGRAGRAVRRRRRRRGQARDIDQPRDVDSLDLGRRRRGDRAADRATCWWRLCCPRRAGSPPRRASPTNGRATVSEGRRRPSSRSRIERQVGHGGVASPPVPDVGQRAERCWAPPGVALLGETPKESLSRIPRRRRELALGQQGIVQGRAGAPNSTAGCPGRRRCRPDSTAPPSESTTGPAPTSVRANGTSSSTRFSLGSGTMSGTLKANWAPMASGAGVVTDQRGVGAGAAAGPRQRRPTATRHHAGTRRTAATRTPPHPPRRPLTPPLPDRPWPGSRRACRPARPRRRSTPLSITYT